MKQGTHETVSQFAGRVDYQLMELQTTFPGAIPQSDEEEIKKGRLYGSLKLHLKSAMTFCREMAMLCLFLVRIWAMGGKGFF